MGHHHNPTTPPTLQLLEGLSGNLLIEMDYLRKLQQTHSKAMNLSYDELDLQIYLKSGTNKMTIKEKSFAFALRSRTIDVKCNKLQGQTNVRCRLGCDQDESQPHLLQCSALIDSNIVKELPNHEDIQGKSAQKIETMSKILLKKFNLLKEISDSSSQECSASALNRVILCT